jgi:peptide/nickel transport system permease protein
MAEATTVSSMPSQRVWLLDWLRRDKRAALSFSFLLLLVVISVAAPWIAPHSPTDQDLANTLVGPTATHWLGTDDLGRDIFSRLLFGARVAIYASALAVGIAVVLGVPVGILAGYLGGWVDDAIGRMIDTFLAFPAIVRAIAVTGALGIGLTNGMIAVGIVFAPQLARLARAKTLVVRQELYVDAARCFGAPTLHILWRHILPNALQPVIVQVTILLAAALLAEALGRVWGSNRPIQAGVRCWPEPTKAWRSRPTRCTPQAWPFSPRHWLSTAWEKAFARNSTRPTGAFERRPPHLSRALPLVRLETACTAAPHTRISRRFRAVGFCRHRAPCRFGRWKRLPKALAEQACCGWRHPTTLRPWIR